MQIKYLEKYDNGIFDIVACKTDDGIKCNTIFINPLCRFLDDADDSKYLVNAISNYSEVLESISIRESEDADLVFDQDYFIFGSIQSEENDSQFTYSKEFVLNIEDLEKVKKKSLELADIILSTLSKNSETIDNLLEDEMTEMIQYNYTPIQEGIIEVFGIVLTSTEENTLGLAVKYYANDDKSLNNRTAISNMFEELLPTIIDDFKNYNFFLVTEPVTIIKLGLLTNGDYVINTNHILLKDLNEAKQTKIKNLLIETYEKI